MPKEKKTLDATTITIIMLVVIAAIVAYSIFSNDEEEQLDSYKNKKIIDVNTTCTKMVEGAEFLKELYKNKGNYTTTQIITAECKTFCQNYNLTLYDWKCTSDDKFLCYCNEK